MGYITFEQLMQFFGLILSVITTVVVILTFTQKKR